MSVRGSWGKEDIAEEARKIARMGRAIIGLSFAAGFGLGWILCGLLLGFHVL